MLVPIDDDVDTICIAGVCTELGDVYVVNITHKKRGDVNKDFKTLEDALVYYRENVRESS